MILDGILFVLSQILRLLLAPLEGINIAIDFLASIPFVMSFFQVIAYIIPWTNFVPLFFIVLAIITYKILISVLKTLWDILPFV